MSKEIIPSVHARLATLLSVICRRLSRAHLRIGIVVLGIGMHAAHSQIAALPQPEYSMKDSNDVDFLSSTTYLENNDLSIGSAEHPLPHAVHSDVDGTWSATVNSGAHLSFLRDTWYTDLLWYTGNRATCSPTIPPTLRVTFGRQSETFQGCLTYTSTDSTKGSTLVFNANGTYSYTRRDGSVVIFSGSPTTLREYSAQQISYPDGRVLTYGNYDDGSGAPLLKSITRSDGLQLKYNYTKVNATDWELTSVAAINNAVEYCSPTAVCSLSKAWPTAQYSWVAASSGSGGVLSVTDSGGRLTRYTEDSVGRTSGIKLPSSSSTDNITYTFCDSNCPQYSFEDQWYIPYHAYVLKVVRDGNTWNYTGVPGATPTSCATPGTYTSVNPAGGQQQATFHNCPGAPGLTYLLQMTDQDGTQIVFNGSPLVQSATTPGGYQNQYFWDVRGNLTQIYKVPKSAPPTPFSLFANYDTTCSIPVKCNEPNWVKDGNGNQTDYTYDPVHGGVLTVTKPADPHGIRPQTRYTYAQRYAWLLNSSGIYVKSAAPIWVLATESYCRTTAAASSGTGCTTASDEVVTTYDYGPDSGPNNLFLRGQAVTADGVTHRTCYGNDIYGNRVSETSPNANLASCP